MKKQIYCEMCGLNEEELKILSGKYVGIGIHHIKPKRQGGDDMWENLIYLCYDCHRLAHTIDGTTLNWKAIDRSITEMLIDIKIKKYNEEEKTRFYTRFFADTKFGYAYEPRR